MVEEASGLGPKDFSRAHDKKQTDVDKEANVADAAVGVLGAAASQLPWLQYEQLLYRCAACMAATVLLHRHHAQRALVLLVQCAWCTAVRMTGARLPPACRVRALVVRLCKESGGGYYWSLLLMVPKYVVCTHQH